MKRRNGFVFIETIIVITILVTALLLIYASFTSVLTSEKERIKYDDIAYIYRTMYLTQFLEENNVQILYDEVDINNFTSFDCGYSGLIESGENGDSVRDFCEGLKTSLEVSHLYMTRYDITPYKRCKSDKSNAGLCGDLVDVEEDMLSYIHSLRIFGDDFNGYRIIASYQGKSDESNCYKSEDGDCLVYNNPTVFYSSLKPANKSRDYDYFKVNIDVINGYTLLSQGKVNVAANRSIDVKIYPNDNYSVNSFAGIQCTNGQYGYIDSGKLKVQHVTADTTCTVSLTEDNSNLWNFSQCDEIIEFSVPNTGFYRLTTYGATGGIGSRYRYDNDPNNANSGLKCHKDINFERDNGIAEGVFKFDEKDKLYVYVGCPGGESIYVNGNPDSSDNTCFSFQTEAGAGGWNGGKIGKGIGAGGTGGATHIALSDNLYYDDLLLDNENLLLVAHGGSSFINDKDGKSKSVPSTKSKISDKVFNGTGNISDENVEHSGLAIIKYLEPVYTVTIEATNGGIKLTNDKIVGEISYDVSKTYLSTPPQVTAIANTGYHYRSFFCTPGQPVRYDKNTGTVTIDSANITSDTTCTVDYAINTYTVKYFATYAQDYNGLHTVNYNTTDSIDIVPLDGYELSGTPYCNNGVTITKNGNTYSVSEITKDTECHIDFVIKKYNITFNVSNGYCSYGNPNNNNIMQDCNGSSHSVPVEYGQARTVESGPNANYVFNSVSCNNGVSITKSGNRFTTGAITANTTCTIAYKASCAYSAGKTWDYAYTGGIQSFTVPCAGTYKLEVWGAQGGSSGSASGGKGGYAVGNIILNSNTALKVNVGVISNHTGATSRNFQSGNDSYGKSHSGTQKIASGGAMSSIMNSSDVHLIIAGGGGGASSGTDSVDGSSAYPGAAGGGLSGTNATGGGYVAANATGGTQSSNGTNGSISYSAASDLRYGGAGGGYHSGGSGCLGSDRGYATTPGAGGSGYIGGVTSGSMQNGVQSGNGKARITLISIN